jgi:uncharacterized protein YggT (Ycf19 family)
MLSIATSILNLSFSPLFGLGLGLLPGIKSILVLLIDLYTLLIVVWALFSWFDHSKGFLHDLYVALDRLVGPYVGLFKRFIPPLGGIDFSPVAAIVVLFIIRALVQFL